MVRSDPQVTWRGLAIGLRVGLLVLLLIPIAFLYILAPTTVTIPLGIIYVVFIVALLAYQIAALVGVTAQERRRQAAAAQSVAARMALVGQPVPPLPPLPMPFTLRLRPNWTYLALFTVGELLFVLAIYILIGVVTGQYQSPADITSNISPYLGSVVILVLLLGTRLWRNATQRIDVNPYGITLQRGVTSAGVYWDTLMLFAQVRAAPLRKNVQRISSYEVSNAQALLRFVWPHNRWTYVVPQDMTQAQYDHYMTLLLHYISARTGLPLMDVR